MEALPRFGPAPPRDLDYPAQYVTCHWKVLRHGKWSAGVHGSAGRRLLRLPFSLPPVRFSLGPLLSRFRLGPLPLPPTSAVPLPPCLRGGVCEGYDEGYDEDDGEDENEDTAI